MSADWQKEENKGEGEKQLEKEKTKEENVREEEERSVGKKFNWKDKGVQNIILAITATAGVLVLAISSAWMVYQKKNYIGEKAAKEKVEKFVKENLIPSDGKLEIKGITKKEGLYEIKLLVSGAEYTSYLTGDGEIFFTQGMNIKEVEEATKKQKEEQEKAMNVEIPKADKPTVEVFVMSYCPFGTQIQKGLIPVMELLKGKAQIDFKYVDYAMHGDKEIDENMNQYCISQKEPTKYLNYLKCFLKAGDSKNCLISEKINQNLLANCVKEIDAKFEIKKKAANKEAWAGSQFPPFDLQKEDNVKYKVQGSPTVVINGTEVPSIQRDPNSLLKKICSAFNTAPAECQTEISSAVPTSGFGEGTTDKTDASAADCAE